MEVKGLTDKQMPNIQYEFFSHFHAFLSSICCTVCFVVCLSLLILIYFVTFLLSHLFSYILTPVSFGFLSYFVFLTYSLVLILFSLKSQG